jgi:hypothetical protein
MSAQFASLMQPCPTTSRHSVIPARNIRQQQAGLSLAFYGGNRPADAEQPVSEKLSQVNTDRRICLSDKYLDTSSVDNDFRVPKQCKGIPKRSTQSLTFAIFTATFVNRSLSCERLHPNSPAKKPILLGRETMVRC